jgi:glycosyltransferase involved in cell wall biosynthesis
VSREQATSADHAASVRPQVAVLTGGGDRPYAIGLASCLVEQGITFDFIGSDDLEEPALREDLHVRFLNLRGDQRPDVSVARKGVRVAKYYVRLMLYALTAEPGVFHILWNNKFEFLDRTLVLMYYRLLGKRIVLTVHNVNVRMRDGNDSPLNRLTLRIQYHLVGHLFVHTEQMKRELQDSFGVSGDKISVIPFGINRTVPDTALTGEEARHRLGLDCADRTMLFFGNIAAYKGLEYLVEAMALIVGRVPNCRLVIAGRPKGAESYWESIRQRISALNLDSIVTQRIEYVPDADTEIYFKAADVLVLPYTHVFQSGVLFLGYNFGLPVIASDVGSLKDDIVEGRTGFVSIPRDAPALARAIERFFSSELYQGLNARRAEIRRFADERYSWTTVGEITKSVYQKVASSGGILIAQKN